MAGSSLILPGLTLLLGILATWLVAHTYYRKSKEYQRLSVGVIDRDSVIKVHSDFKERLNITLDDEPIEAITLFEIVIGNTGNRPLGPPVEPLRIHAPDSADFLGATITHKHPDGRNVDMVPEFTEDGGVNSIQVPYSVLNPGDNVRLQLVVRGDVRRSQLRFSIEAEGIEPELEAEEFELEWLIPEKHRREHVGGLRGTMIGSLLAVLGGGLVFIVAAHVARSWGLWVSWPVQEPVWVIVLGVLGSLVGGLQGVILLMLGVFIMLAAWLDGIRLPSFRPYLPGPGPEDAEEELPE